MPSALRNALVAGAVVVAALAASPILLPAYREAVRFTADTGLPLVVPDVGVASAGAEGWRVFRRLPDGTESDILGIPPNSLNEIYLGGVLLPLLLALTPVPMKRRGMLVAVGLGLLLCLQAFLFVVFVAAWVHYQRTDSNDPVYAWLTILHSTFGQLAALPIWAGLTWRHWFGPLPFPNRRPKPSLSKSGGRAAA